jgi:UPF0755 protein
MKKLLLVVGVLLVLAAVALGGGLLWLKHGIETAKGPADAPELEFEVPKGATARSLGPLLVEQGLITDARFWRFHLRRNGGLQPKAGRHLLRASMTIPEIGAALEAAPIAEDMPFVMIEGWRLRDTDAALAEKGWSRPGDYLRAASEPSRFKAPFPLPARGLEGYLYPETYRVVVEGFDLDALVQRQLDTFVTRFYEPHREEIAQSGRTLDELVIMASMLEREEPVPAQRPLVAGILWKRIDRKFPLGVDATSRYELAEWNDRKAFLKRLRDPEDPWNTRVKPGLPPGPIGAPTVESLLAALRPEKSQYLYYLHDANKVLRPSRNAEEHEALRKKYNVY